MVTLLPHELLLIATTVSYPCSRASVGVTVLASKRSTVSMPDCASMLLRKVVGGTESAYRRRMWWPVGTPQAGVGEGVGVGAGGPQSGSAKLSISPGLRPPVLHSHRVD